MLRRCEILRSIIYPGGGGAVDICMFPLASFPWSILPQLQEEQQEPLGDLTLPTFLCMMDPPHPLGLRSLIPATIVHLHMSIHPPTAESDHVHPAECRAHSLLKNDTGETDR